MKASSLSVLSSDQCMRMTTAIMASVPVRTSDMRCSADGPHSPGTPSVRPMGVTRIAVSARPDGSAWPLSGANTACSTPCLRYQLRWIRDRTVLADKAKKSNDPIGSMCPGVGR